MARWYGNIGFAKTVETSPGIWSDETENRVYYGDVLRKSYRWQNGESINDDLSIDHQISIIADQFAYENSYAMKYVEFMGAKWKITNVQVEHPRLILTIGGVYNGQ